MAGSMLHVAARLVITRANPPPQFATPPILVENLAGDGLLIEWQVKKRSGPTPDQAEISVHNMAPNFRAQISTLAAMGFPTAVDLYVGWEKLPELLFSGQAWKLRPERRTGTDIVTTFEAGAGALAVRDTPPAGGATIGLAMKLVITKLIVNLGLVPSPTALGVISERSAALPLSAWQNVYDQTPSDQLDICMATLGLSWGESGGFFVIYADGLRNDVLPAVLTPVSGLLMWEEQDEGAVMFEALAQPRVDTGVQLSLADALGATIGGGPLRVDEIDFSGSTDGKSIMTGTARKVAIL
jgi:hypothetical protein